MSKLWGYRIPALSEPYVYLQSLLTDPYSPSKKIANWASYLLEIDAYEDPDLMIQRFSDAFAFLKEVADAQKAHELNFIQSRIQDIKSLGLNGTETEELFSMLEDMKANDHIDYKIFIKGLNTIINSLDKYITRVKAFNTTGISNIPQVRMVENLTTTLGSFINKRGAIYYSQEEAIRQLAIQWLNQKGKDFIAEQMANGISGAKNITAALAIITQQLARFIYDKRLLIEKHTKKGKFSDFSTVEEFNKFIQTFDLNTFEQYSNISTVLQDQQLLDDIQKMYGIDYDKAIKMNGHKISKKASKEMQNIKATLNNEPMITDNFKTILSHITIGWDGHVKSQHKLAFQNELVSSLASAFDVHKHLGGLEMGTDMLLGNISIGLNFNETSGEVSNTLETIVSRLRAESAINDIEKSSKIYLEEMQELSKKINNLQKAFIIHETNKNYNTLERGKWPTGMNSFEGRTMKIGNYINAIAQMGNIQGIDTKWLQFACLNVATDALGATLKEPLEHLLAIFGGIIMFDDFAIIGKEITENMTFSNIENLHLYKLQDIYVPASTFLYATYDAFSTLGQSLFSGNGFNASITVPTIDYYNNYTGRFIEKWPQVKMNAEKATTIKLTFATNFLTMMSQIL